MKSYIYKPIKTIGYCSILTNSTYSVCKAFLNSANLLDVFYAGVIDGAIKGYQTNRKLSADNMSRIRGEVIDIVPFEAISINVFEQYSGSIASWEKKINDFDKKIQRNFLEQNGSKRDSIPLKSDIFIYAPGNTSIAMDIMYKKSMLDEEDELGKKTIAISNKIQSYTNATICTASTYIFRLGSTIGSAIGKTNEYFIGCDEKDKSSLRKWTEQAGLNVLRASLFGLFIFRNLAKLGFNIFHIATSVFIGLFDGLFIGMTEEQRKQVEDSILENSDGLAAIASAVTGNIKDAFDIAYQNAYNDITGKDKKVMEEMMNSNPFNMAKATQLEVRRVTRSIMGEQFFDKNMSSISALIDASNGVACDFGYRSAFSFGCIVRDLFVSRNQIAI